MLNKKAIKDLEDRKYQERLPWESKHITPYIPLLNKKNYLKAGYTCSLKNYETVDSIGDYLKLKLLKSKTKRGQANQEDEEGGGELF